MRARVAVLAMSGLVFAAACSGGGGAGGGSANSADSAAQSTTTDVEAGAVVVPAGVNWTRSSLAPPADSLAVATFEHVTATAGVPAAPPGHPFRQAHLITKRFNFGEMRFATGTCACWEGGNSVGVFGGLRTPIYLFRSVDAGTTWAQVDLSGVLGDVNGQINSMIESEGGLVLIATTSDSTGATPNVVNVLRSTDGVTWQRLSTIVSDAATAVPVHAFDIYALGSSFVVHGADMACEFDGHSAIQNIGPTYQTRFWTSTDGGATWLAQSAADTAVDNGRTPLPDAVACEGLGIGEVTRQFGHMARLVAVVNDQLFVWSQNGERVASSDDGLSWSTNMLEGATALPSEQVPEPNVTSEASTILFVEGQYVAMNLEDYRNIDDTAAGRSVGLSVMTWTSDDGSTWQRQPLGRPIRAITNTANYQFFVTDSGLGLRVFNRVDQVELGMYESVAGTAEDWTTCEAVADAECAFATEVGAFEPGADLSGIDLSFTSIVGRDLTDVSFEGALLHTTTFADVTIDRTNFDGAEVSNNVLRGDLTTSTFVGATLTSVTFDAQFLTSGLDGATVLSPIIEIGDEGLPQGLSLVGRDLTDFAFTDGTLAGVDFSGANLSSAAFSFTDLTGAVFAGAVLDGIFFYEVTCPDGQSTAQGAFGAAACRL